MTDDADHMTDIVERLREPVDPDDPDLWKVDRDRLAACCEIERLRVSLREMADACEHLVNMLEGKAERGRFKGVEKAGSTK
jgi:hypothetical protein